MSHSGLRARLLLLRRQFFCWRWLSGTCCVVTYSVVLLAGSTFMYTVAQGIAGMSPTLRISLIRRKNKSSLSCLHLPAVSLHRLLSPASTGNGEPQRRKGKGKLNLDIMEVDKELCQTRGKYTCTAEPLPTRMHTYNQARVCYASYAPLPLFNIRYIAPLHPLPRHLPPSQCRRRPSFLLGRRILSAPTFSLATTRTRET